MSASGFGITGTKPVIGRLYTADDDRAAATPVVVISNDIWKNRYGSDPAIVGRTIKINGQPATVIGVMAPDMKFPFNNDLWLPLSQLPAEVVNAKRGVRNFQAIGRLAPGVTLAQARAELEGIVSRLAQDFLDTNKDLRPAVMTYNERVRQRSDQSGVPGLDGRRRLRAADRMRERGQPAAGAIGAAIA
jgi:hypothetical protein